MFAGNPGVCSTSVNKRATSHSRVAQHLFPAHFHLIQGEFWGDILLGTLNKEEMEVTLGKMLVFPSAKKTALRLTISFSGVQFFLCLAKILVYFVLVFLVKFLAFVSGCSRLLKKFRSSHWDTLFLGGQQSSGAL